MSDATEKKTCPHCGHTKAFIHKNACSRCGRENNGLEMKKEKHGRTRLRPIK